MAIGNVRGNESRSSLINVEQSYNVRVTADEGLITRNEVSCKVAEILVQEEVERLNGGILGCQDHIFEKSHYLGSSFHQDRRLGNFLSEELDQDHLSPPPVAIIDHQDHISDKSEFLGNSSDQVCIFENSQSEDHNQLSPPPVITEELGVQSKEQGADRQEEVSQSGKLENTDFHLKRGCRFSPTEWEIYRYLDRWKQKQQFNDDWVNLAQIDTHASDFPWEICKKPLFGNVDTWYFLSWIKLKVGGVDRSFAAGGGQWDQIGSRKHAASGLISRKYRFSSEKGIEEAGFEWTLEEFQISCYDHEAFCRLKRSRLSKSRKRKAKPAGSQPAPKQTRKVLPSDDLDVHDVAESGPEGDA